MCPCQNDLYGGKEVSKKTLEGFIMAIKYDMFGNEVVERHIDSSWLARYGPEANKLGLNKEEMLACQAVGITPEQFAASKGRSEAAKAVVAGKPLPAPAAAKVEPLTKEQLLICSQMGITPEQFQKTTERLQAANKML
jgi:hypothetical protein